jgi:hypothetical protein
MAFVAQMHDTHANLWSSLQVRPPTGNCLLPVVIRFVEENAVVSGFSQADAAHATGLKVGDAILDLDGTPIRQLIDRWSPYYAASNESTRLRDIARSITRGDCGPSSLRVRRQGETITVNTARVPSSTLNAQAGTTHDLSGQTFRKLSKDVANLKLSSVKITDAAHYVDAANDTKALVIDIRNYPSEFVVFGSLLVDKKTELRDSPPAIFQTPVLSTGIRRSR